MRIYLNEYIHPAAVAYLRANAEIVTDMQQIDTVDGMIVRGTRVSRELIEQAKNLKVIGRHGVGFEKIDLDAAKEHHIRVLNAPTANAVSVAELIVARFLEMSRDLYKANVKLREGGFARIAPPDMVGTEISGKTLGLIGMGNIPRLVAEMMRSAFHVRIVGYDPFVSREEADKRGMVKIETLEETLRLSDLVTISVHLTPDTRNMIHGELFDCFKPGAIFVNASRGGIVDENGLYEALVSGKLRAAAFDVFENEPLPADSPLLTLMNFSATPHIGGNTEEALYRTGMAIAENVVKVIRGEPAEGVVV